MTPKDDFRRLNAQEQRAMLSEYKIVHGAARNALTATDRCRVWDCYCDTGLVNARDLAAILAGDKAPDNKQQQQRPEPKKEEKPAPMEKTPEQMAMAVEALRQIFGGGAQVDPERVKEIAKEVVTEAIQAAKLPREIVVKTPDKPPVRVGRQHYLFEEILQLSQVRKHDGHRHNLMLVGPAGSGKSTLAKNVAKALGLPYYFIALGPQTTMSSLAGYTDAGGNYVSTILRRAYETGGVLLLDEMDAANGAVLTWLNGLLDNGHGSYPDGMVDRHGDLFVIAAANTYGRGADRIYCGRQQLDGATLERFLVLDFDYDEDLERDLAGNDTWTAFVQGCRAKAAELRERIIISPRASIYGAQLLAAGVTWERAESLVLWKGISEDIKNKVRASDLVAKAA